ncbi:Very-long-chain (3R)-3-hydroxyacyl-CoA dehydratase 2 [Vitis vinifera]|uniref:Very-long-chain (3R)-3-hydroxyacyl-CoA dehydratase n=1 Tax=Vitis vinifera TaxID=29760 RepID=A0A438G1T4_VITVI|nr:Very-long-chain (3R)-3-hydroxyacyl-CoA dehydratase 2 [Vitis vinifera]
MLGFGDCERFEGFENETFTWNETTSVLNIKRSTWRRSLVLGIWRRSRQGAVFAFPGNDVVWVCFKTFCWVADNAESAYPAIQGHIIERMHQLANLYLLAYNSLQALGWAVSLSRILSSFLDTRSFNGAYASAGDLVCLLQTVSFLEVVHGAIGLVPSGVLLPLMQWGGRTHFLLAIVRRIVEVQELPSVFITFIAWSISEVIRYSHYALHCMGSCPSCITYLRYTAFILLYPVGVAPGEMWLMYQALPFIKRKNISHYYFVWVSLVSVRMVISGWVNQVPMGDGFGIFVLEFGLGVLNVVSDLDIWYSAVAPPFGTEFGHIKPVSRQVVLLCYPFLWLKLYLHLFKQRRSKLGKHDGKKRR